MYFCADDWATQVYVFIEWLAHVPLTSTPIGGTLEGMWGNEWRFRRCLSLTWQTVELQQAGWRVQLSRYMQIKGYCWRSCPYCSRINQLIHFKSIHQYTYTHKEKLWQLFQKQSLIFFLLQKNQRPPWAYIPLHTNVWKDVWQLEFEVSNKCIMLNLRMTWSFVFGQSGCNSVAFDNWRLLLFALLEIWHYRRDKQAWTLTPNLMGM